MSFSWAETQKDGTIPTFAVRKNDPYQVGHLYESNGIMLTTMFSIKLGLATRMIRKGDTMLNDD